MRKILLFILCLVLAGKLFAQTQYNVVFILSDDHRYDAMGFMNKFKGLKTPNMDMMAAQGAHIRNAFVATALCSPSRASILTGLYPHAHTVVDNQSPVPENLRFFPEYLKQKGYQTAFLGKWHMGIGGEKKQKGFDYWVSFRGQGIYYNPTLFVNGETKVFKDSAYVTDLLTDYAIEFLDKRNKSKPFFIYLSHKGVHDGFQAARRHKGMYKNLVFEAPPSMFITATDTAKYMNLWKEKGSIKTQGGYPVNQNDIPKWVRHQRYSWHGVDFMYHGARTFMDFYPAYLETLMGVDESIGTVISYLKNNDLLKNTVVFYMGDNGFSFGEHGLIDKRHAYEESMRVPLLVYAPSLIQPSTKVDQVIQNVDIAPTILDMAGIVKPVHFQGSSFLPFLKNETMEWRDRAFYEYYWEYDFPQTPSMFAVRTNQYKYIYNYGIWDTNELFDLQNDPYEMNNLINKPEHKQRALGFRKEIFNWLEQTGGMQIPLRPLGNQSRSDHIFKGRY